MPGSLRILLMWLDAEVGVFVKSGIKMFSSATSFTSCGLFRFSTPLLQTGPITDLDSPKVSSTCDVFLLFSLIMTSFMTLSVTCPITFALVKVCTCM